MGVNYIGQYMDALVSHLHVEHLEHLPQQLPYIITGEELWVTGDFCIGTRGAQEEDDE